MISLLKGDFTNQNIDLVLLHFCQRHKINASYVEKIKELLTLVISDDCDEVFKSLRSFKVKPQWLALLGRKMITLSDVS